MATENKKQVFQGILAWLRGLGIIGRFIAWILQGAAAYIGVTVPALAALALGWLKAPIAWAQQPSVYVTALVFLFLLWTWIGVRMLRRPKEVQIVRAHVDYAFGIVIDGGWRAEFGKLSSDYGQDAGKPAVSLAVTLRNLCAAPIRARLVKSRVVLNTRTHDETNLTAEMVLPRLGAKAFTSAGVVIDPAETYFSGTVSITVLYGPYDGSAVRQFTQLVNVQIAIDKEKGLATLKDSIVSDSDEPYAEK
jgi:hypothetical protein